MFALPVAGIVVARNKQSGSRAVIFYDGDCGLCNRFVLFVLERDPNGHFHFASLQSDYAARTLRPHGIDPKALDSVVITTTEGAVLQKATAVFYVFRRLSIAWRIASSLRVLPDALLDSGYDFIAQRRAAIPHSDACAVPRAQWSHRFIDAKSD
jgi:predicted DCC family thiol-disulfide oxidoreductase YuxK